MTHVLSVSWRECGVIATDGGDLKHRDRRRPTPALPRSESEFVAPQIEGLADAGGSWQWHVLAVARPHSWVVIDWRRTFSTGTGRLAGLTSKDHPPRMRNSCASSSRSKKRTQSAAARPLSEARFPNAKAHDQIFTLPRQSSVPLKAC